MSAYVEADPINFTDPLGLQEVEPPPIVVTGSTCPEGWTCYDPGFEFQTLWRPVPGITGGEIVVTASKGGGKSSSKLLNLFFDLRRLVRSAICAVPSLELGGEVASYRGFGNRVSGALSYNTRTGDVFLKGSFGGGLGFGGGGAFGLSAQTSTTTAGVFGSVDSRVAAGRGAVGIDVTQNWMTVVHGQNIGSQGRSGSIGIAKGYGEAYVAPVEVNISRATRIGNLGKICG